MHSFSPHGQQSDSYADAFVVGSCSERHVYLLEQIITSTSSPFKAKTPDQFSKSNGIEQGIFLQGIESTVKEGFLRDPGRVKRRKLG